MWTPDGVQVFDSGDELERITAAAAARRASTATTTANDSFDTRSDDKGPEPEGPHGRQALRAARTRSSASSASGGVIVYDVTEPDTARVRRLRQHTGTSTATRRLGTAGDLGPGRSSSSIRPSDSPNGEPLLIVEQRGQRHDDLSTNHDDRGGDPRIMQFSVRVDF